MKLIRAKATGVLIGVCGLALIGVGSGADGKDLAAPKPQEANGPCQITNNPVPDHVTANYTVRSYLDDLVVPGDCVFNTFTVKGAWDTLPPGSGSTVELFFHADIGGQPSSIPFLAATVTSYSEQATGVDYFGRPESEVSITFNDLFLSAGTVWINVKVIGPEIFHPSLGCTGRQGSIAWGFTDFFLLPAPIQFFAVDFCDSLSDLSWSIGSTP